MPRISQVMIAGCGPVGLALANCLVRSPYIQSVILLDRQIPKSTRQLPPIANQRVYSINGPSLNLLQNLNSLPLIRQKGTMSNIQVVSKQSLSFLNWSQNNANIIENDQLIYALINALQKSQHNHKIQYYQDQVQNIQRNQQFCSVRLKNNKEQQIKTKLLVGSDGINSNIKRLTGITHYGWHYRQKAIACTMKINQSIKNAENGVFQNKTAYQIYHDGNVLALLPLWGNYVSLVWSLGLPDFQHLMQLQNQQFMKKLNNVIKNSNHQLYTKASYKTIPYITQIVNKRLSFPLATLQSSAYTQDRIALIGDAAHTIHPMAGLGVNSGIMDSILLANNIKKNIKTGNDIGDAIALSQYQAKAKVHNYSHSFAMQGIKKSFETDAWMFNKLREVGMGLVQNSSMMKDILKKSVDDKSLQYQWDVV